MRNPRAFSGPVDRPSAATWMVAASLTVLLLAGCHGPSAEVRELNRRGLEHYRAGRHFEAIATFEMAREKDRETPEPGYYIGRAYLALADQHFRDDNLVTAVRYCDRAIRAFTDAYEGFPGYTRALQGKADALKRKGQHEAALALADWAGRNCGPQANKVIFQAREHAQHGDVDKAADLLHQAVRLEPKNPATHAELGRFYARFGNRPAAIASLREAYRLDPRAPGVEKTLASMHESSEY